MNSYDPTDTHSQEQAREEQETRQRLAAQIEESDLKWLMSSKKGRRILWRLMVQSRVFDLSFSTNAMQMAFNEGHRNFGNRSLKLVNAYCPELYPVMAREAKENENAGSNGHDGHNSN